MITYSGIEVFNVSNLLIMCPYGLLLVNIGYGLFGLWRSSAYFSRACLHSTYNSCFKGSQKI